MRTHMECRSLGEERSNYNTVSSVRQIRQQESNYKKKNKSSGGGGQVIAGLAVGAAAGVIAGMLLAPDKGTATRKKVTTSAKKYSDQVTSQVNDWKNKKNKGGGQSYDTNDDFDLRPTTATGRAFTSTGGPAHGGPSQNSPYTDPNKRSDSEVKSMINDPKTPGATDGPSIPPKV